MKDEKKDKKLMARLKNKWYRPIEWEVFRSSLPISGEPYQIDGIKVVDVIMRKNRVITVNFEDNKYLTFSTDDSTKTEGCLNMKDSGTIRGKRSNLIMFDDTCHPGSAYLTSTRTQDIIAEPEHMSLNELIDTMNTLRNRASELRTSSTEYGRILNNVSRFISNLDE